MALRLDIVAVIVPSSATVSLSTKLSGILEKGYRVTYICPAHIEPLGGPATTSQYVPAGNPLDSFAFQVESSLLIATKPDVPRANAICCDDGETQLVSALEEAAETLFRKPVMPTTAGQRC